MLGPLTAYSRSSAPIDTTQLSRTIIALQTLAYCGVFILLAVSAFGYALFSLLCAFGLGTLQFLLHDH
jgi:TM2 domain-containing membrane protein YozV